jgi:hypothetical protein
MSKKRIGWTMVVLGAIFLAACITWAAIVWGDDDARMAAAGAIAGLGVVGILGLVWGFSLVAPDSSGGEGFDNYNF